MGNPPRPSSPIGRVPEGKGRAMRARESGIEMCASRCEWSPVCLFTADRFELLDARVLDVSLLHATVQSRLQLRHLLLQRMETRGGVSGHWPRYGRGCTSREKKRIPTYLQ